MIWLAANVVVPLPVPELPETGVMNDDRDAADHPHEAVPVTVNVNWPPCHETLTEDGVTENAQDEEGAACVTVMSCPAMRTAPDREAGPGLAAIEN
jgi:hypothetical protein